MKTDAFLGYFRDLLKLCGTGLVTRGVLAEDQLQAGAGALITLLGILWSAWRRWQRLKAGADSAQPCRPALNLLGLCGLPAAMLLFCGCASTANSPWVPAAGLIAQVAAREGTLARLRAHPEELAAFEVGHAALGKIVEGDQWDPATLKAALAQLPVSQLAGGQSVLFIGDLVQLWDATSPELTAESAPALQAVVVGVYRGVGQALELQAGATRAALTPASASKVPPRPAKKLRI